jgi:DNA-binding XRE family transcriptional regulator
MSAGGSGPDLRKPEWARPLAPLPEWLDSVDRILRKARPESGGEAEWEIFVGGGYYETGSGPYPVPETTSNLSQNIRRDSMKRFCERYRLTPEQAAEILGHENAAAIESAQPPRRNTRRQEALAHRRWGSPITDRCAWLKDWRARLGFTQRDAAIRLGYSARQEISRVENRWSTPSWEKLLIAIFVEGEHGVVET